MKTYLEFQNEVREIILDELKKPKSHYQRLGKRKSLSDQELVALECAEKIAYKVHHEIYPLAPDKEFQGGIE